MIEPLRSKTFIMLLPGSILCINSKCTGVMSSICTVKIPYILAIIESGFCFKNNTYSGKQFLNTFSSELFIVLIRNRLSKEKKKNEPDLPADSLALNTYCLLLSGFKLNSISSDEIPSISLITSNNAGLYAMVVHYSLIVIVESSSLSNSWEILICSLILSGSLTRSSFFEIIVVGFWDLASTLTIVISFWLYWLQILF